MKIKLGIFGVILAFALIELSLTACAPSTSSLPNTQSSSAASSNNNDLRQRESGDNSPDCRGDSRCEDDCDLMYPARGEAADCIDLSSRQVAELFDIHDLVTNEGNANIRESDLEKLSEEDDDYDIKSFELYLEIGSSAWTEWIENTGGKTDYYNSPASSADAQTIVEWIADNENITKALSSADKGDEVLEALLEKAAGNCSNCISNSTPTAGGRPDQLFAVSGKELQIATPTVEKIELDNNNDANLYKHLSSLSFNNENIFSLSANEKNEDLFAMAFNLLSSVCENAENNDDDEQTACKRALMCWTEAKTDDDVFDEYGAENHQDALEDDDGGDFDDCTASHFNELL